MRGLRLPARCIAVCFTVLASTAAAATPDFARDVRPILDRACASCHNDTFSQGGLSLQSREAVLRGGVSGPALKPGDGAGSLLVRRLAKGPLTQMPMGLPPLAEAELGTLKAWIDAGAIWGAPGPDYAREIRPIFEARCVRCHGPSLQQSQLRLDSRGAALKGGLSGAVIVPGKSQDSLLVQRLLGKLSPRMPFEGPPLEADEIARVRAWIDAGAPGPSDVTVAVKRHWAYVKPEKVEPPRVDGEGWVRNAVDRFVAARLACEG